MYFKTTSFSFFFSICINQKALNLKEKKRYLILYYKSSIQRINYFYRKMGKIEILTANNVAIQYEMASLVQRILAFLFDGVFLALYYVIISFLNSEIFINRVSSVVILVYVLFYSVFFFYNLFCEINFDGQTLGKRIMNIKVIKVTGEVLSANDFFIRWANRIIDICVFTRALATMFISSSDIGRRIGDIFANTTLIKLNPYTKYSIKDILKIDKNKEYELEFNQVTKLTDEDKLLIKNTIDRIRNIQIKQIRVLQWN